MGTIVNKTKHKEPTNQNDVEALQLHDSNSHEVNEKIFPNNPAAAVYKQEVDSNNPGKHYTHTHTPYNTLPPLPYKRGLTPNPNTGST